MVVVVLLLPPLLTASVETGEFCLRDCCIGAMNLLSNSKHRIFREQAVFMQRSSPCSAGQVQLSDTVQHIAKLYAKGVARHGDRIRIAELL